MSHTKRIYNKPKIKKAQRIKIDEASTYISGGGNLSKGGIPLTRRGYICRGRCLSCRDPKRETRSIRRRNKENFKHELAQETTSSEPAMTAIEIYGGLFFGAEN